MHILRDETAAAMLAGSAARWPRRIAAAPAGRPVDPARLREALTPHNAPHPQSGRDGRRLLVKGGRR